MAIIVENVKESFSHPTTQTIKCLVAGPPGSGKTRSASTWPNCIYADAEGRLLSIRDRSVRRVEIASINDLDELKAALDQNPDVRAKMLDGPVDSVVVDTVDEVARIIIRERLRSEKKETMAIADWGYLGDTLRALLRGYRNLPINVVFNAHLRSEEDSETGRVRYKAAIQGAVGDQIAEFVDECFLMVARPMTDPLTGERVITRYLQTFPDSQHNWIKDHSGALPQEFPINFEDDYERMAALIFGEPTVEAKPEPTPTIVRTAKAVPKKAPSPRGRQPLAATVDVPLPPEDVAAPTAPPEPPAAPPEPEPEPPGVPDSGTPSGISDPLEDLGATFRCDVCGKPVENPDYQDLSMIRFGKPLCRAHFVERSKK